MSLVAFSFIGKKKSSGFFFFHAVCVRLCSALVYSQKHFIISHQQITGIHILGSLGFIIIFSFCLLYVQPLSVYKLRLLSSKLLL